jgi:dolichyl-phosphate beta-glucosyltransferase
MAPHPCESPSPACNPSDGDGAPELTVVIPAFDEEQRLGATLDRIASYFAARAMRAEIIVVDDGSRDGTRQCVTRRFEKIPALRLVSFGENRGKGAAVATGVAQATGRFILLYDADSAAPIEELDRFLDGARRGAAILIGSRYTTGTRAERNRIRSLTGRIYAGLVSPWLLPGIRDSQCGFKLLRKAAAKALFPQLRLSGFAFDAELLFLARHQGYSVVELPIAWQDVPGSKLRLFRDTMLMLRDTWKIRRLHRDPFWSTPDPDRAEPGASLPAGSHPHVHEPEGS